jgi:hypothetical protein
MLHDTGSSHLLKGGSARAEALLRHKLKRKGFGVRGKKRVGGGRKGGRSGVMYRLFTRAVSRSDGYKEWRKTVRENDIVVSFIMYREA